MKQADIFRSDSHGACMEAISTQPLCPDTNGQEANLIQLYTDIPRQVIQGFGGAFTQSSSGIYEALNDSGKHEVLRLLFSSDGLAYNCGRIPIGACDFSEGDYSYCDEADPSLSAFSMERDARLIFPFIRDAMALEPALELLASPWSPPAWMKTNSDMCHGGKLKEDCYGAFAEYLIRYLQACRSENIPVRFLTCQNEPKAVQIWESCTYTAQDEQRFIRDYLSPALKRAGLEDIGVVIWDHNKERSFLRAREILNCEDMRKLVRGIAFHWYSGDHFENLALCREFFSGQELMFTEGCVELTTEKTVMGAKAQASCQKSGVENAPWIFGEFYAHDIIGNLNAGMSRFLDWNLMLDTQGGPNHVGNYCSAPLICDVRTGRVFPQPSYHAIAHFSRFLPRGSQCIAVSRYTQELEVAAAQTPDGSLIAVVLNSTDKMLPAVFSLLPQSLICKADIPPHSLETWVFHA
ncbi:glycoside hydrolase family 30 protein [Ruthenibacterium lactatiformans]|uniref:glycoside hydrolase family 30 protein n=1 Tax=Ruthenibacterium lactatiformans TaxID=1550024 RepID=UPI0030B9BED7